MGEPLITVVVPVYNAENYLDECVKSILAQSYTSWELILVNDGSTDGSPTLCDGWQSRDERIRAIHKANGGVSSARNAGMDAAKGEYLAFVDADDWVEPEYLQVLCGGMKLADVAICGVDTGEPTAPPAEETVTLETMRRTPSRYTDLHYVNYSVNKLFRMEILRKYAIKVPETMRRSEDVYFVNAYLEHCNTLHASSAKLYHYRANPVSATHSFYEGVCRDEGVIMEVQYEFFHKFELSKEEENAYRVWEYGKVLTILRHILNSGHFSQVKELREFLIQEFFSMPRIAAVLEKAPPQVGKKPRIAAFFLRKKWCGAFIFTMKALDV